MYLGADHEKAPDAHSNNAGLSTIGHRSGIPSCILASNNMEA